MVTKTSRQLTDLVFPECLQLAHGIQCYRGLEAVAADSLSDALARGFFPIREPATPDDPTPFWFITESDLPAFRALVEEVRVLRVEKAAQRKHEAHLRRTRERQERLDALIEVLRQAHALHEDEVPFVEQLCRRTKLRHVRLAYVLPRLHLHRRQQAMALASLHSVNTSPRVRLCRCPLCTISVRPWELWGNTKACETFARLSKALWKEGEARSRASHMLGSMIDDAPPEEVLRCHYRAVSGVVETQLRSLVPGPLVHTLRDERGAHVTAAPEPEATVSEVQRETWWDETYAAWTSLSASDLAPFVDEALTKELRTYRKHCVTRRWHGLWQRALLRWERECFRPRWQVEQEAWWAEARTTLRTLKLHRDEAIHANLTRIIKRHYGQVREAIQQGAKGQPISVLLARLERVFVLCHREWSKELDALRRRVALQALVSGRSAYPALYPLARSLKRKLLFFCGPTNSGKTHAAFDELAKAERGAYLAPLRLLALEGQERLQERGLKASFLTGEERELVPGARFTSSTIEMASMQKTLGCVVIDEIQMLAHPQRGWAWVQALVGVPAHRVIMAGSEDALPLVEQIAERLQEPLEVRRFSRFNELRVHEKASALADVQPGTAIVCFSRRAVLEYKARIEAETDFQVSVIYGALSPDVRRTEARRFREGETQILVATDAIGMGLNLPIQTLLLSTTKKKILSVERRLLPTEIKQIAGRAGRYGQASHGEVGALEDTDIQIIRQALYEPLPVLEGPLAVAPTLQHLEDIVSVVEHQELPRLLEDFRRERWFSDSLFAPKITLSMLELAEYLAPIMRDASLALKFALAQAPVRQHSKLMIEVLGEMAERLMQATVVRVHPSILLPFLCTATEDDFLIAEAERTVQFLTLYRWLSYRLPDLFPQRRRATNYTMWLNFLIGRSLRKGIS